MAITNKTTLEQLTLKYGALVAIDVNSQEIAVICSDYMDVIVMNSPDGSETDPEQFYNDMMESN